MFAREFEADSVRGGMTALCVVRTRACGRAFVSDLFFRPRRGLRGLPMTREEPLETQG